ncbi:MAG TPA: TlpA disulfide reductase family protein [Candidatus Angelobacter sp.]|nr:TlpA disulfide reductase family protein [Candidatus Angelobacter sp.]
MNRSLIFVVFIVLVITGFLFLGKRMSKDGQTQTSAKQGAASSAPDFHPTQSAGPGTGSLAPDFDLKVLDGNGKTMKLSSLRGKAVILDFWATYCGPCKIEMPWFVELQNKYGKDGLQIVGVAVDDAGEKAISEFTHKMGINYPILIGTEKVADLYGGLDGLPTTFFIDRSGKIIDRQLGLISESVIVDNIKKGLASGGNSSSTAAAGQ